MILDKKLFKQTEVVARTVAFPDGEATLHFKTLSAMEFGVLAAALNAPDLGERAHAFAWAIAKSLCNPDGSQIDDDGAPVITIEQVKTLKDEPFAKLLNIVLEINQRTDPKP